MERLPDDFVPIVAGYLPPLDAIALSRTCKRARSQLSLAATRPRLILADFSRRDNDDADHYGFAIPVPSSSVAHSVALSIRWRDQGWGNRKGRVIIAEVYEGDQTSTGEFGGGWALFRSDLAPHEEEHLTIWFQPREGASYHLWYGVGGGGGHSLHLEEVCVRSLLFDGSGVLSKAHDFLIAEGISRPWDCRMVPVDRKALHTVLASASHLLAQGSKLPPPMIDFFCIGGLIDADADLSFELVHSMQLLLKDWDAEHFAYTQLCGMRQDDEDSLEQLRYNRNRLDQLLAPSP